MESGISGGNRAPGRCPPAKPSHAPAATRCEKPCGGSADVCGRNPALRHGGAIGRRRIAAAGEAGDEAQLESDDAHGLLGVALNWRVESAKFKMDEISSGFSPKV